jgi:hypothetical protein
MSGPKIRVGLDVAGIQADLDKVEQAGKKVSEAIGKGLDAQSAKDGLVDLVKLSEQLADKLGEAAEQDILDVDSLSRGVKVLEDAVRAATEFEKHAYGKVGAKTAGLSKVIDEYKLVENHLRRLRNAQETLSRDSVRITERELEAKKRAYDKWRQSGAFGSRPFRNVEFDAALTGGASQFGPGAWRRFQGVAGLQSAGGPSFLSTIGRTAGHGVMASVLPGNVGTNVAGLAAREAMAAEGGLLSGRGLAMLGGGALVGGLAYGAVRAIQGVHASLSGAQGEAITLADLRQSIGPLTTDFQTLRDTVRNLSDGFGVAYNETASFAREMGRISGAVDEDLRTGIGFGRGYGIDPGQSTRFFAEMRHLGGARNESDNRRLALLIGEAVNRGGTGNRMDEVLSAIGSFTQLAARQSLTAPNVGGYTSLLSSLTGLNLPGLSGDPGSAAAILGQADAALRRGGAFGEASQNFTLGMLQRSLPGVSALDMALINEQGAFGRISDAFGEHSPAYRMARELGNQGALTRYRRLAAGDDGRTNLARALQGLEEQSGGDLDFFRKSVAGHLGLSESQSAALVTAYRQDPGLGRLEARLKQADVDPRTMSMGSIGRLTELLGSTDQSKLLAQRDKLRGMKGLSKDERESLGGSGEALVNAIIRLTAKYDDQDEGQKAREAQISLDNEFQKFAAELIPLTTDIRDWIADAARSISRIPGVGGSEFVKAMDARRDAEVSSAIAGLANTEFYGDASVAGTPLDPADASLGNDAVKVMTAPGLSLPDRRKYLESYRERLKWHPEQFPDGFRDFLDEYERRLNAAPKPGDLLPAEGALPNGIGDLPEPTLPTDVAPAGASLRRYASDRRVSYLANRVLAPSKYDGLLQDAAQRYGVDWRDLKQLVAQESDFNPGADNGSDRGLMQLNRRFDRERGVTNPFDPRENVMIGARVWRDALRAAGGNRWGAFRRYNGAGPKAEGYANDAMVVNRRWRSGAGGFDAKIPAGRRDNHASIDGRHNLAFSHQHNHVITIQDPRGIPLDATSAINTHVGPPIPAGMG